MGLITPRGMLNLAIITFLLSAIVGIPMIMRGGLPILYLGIVGFISGLFYTAPPFRLSSRKGMGELLIGLNFGPLMTVGAALVQTGKILPEAIYAGIPIGFLVSAIVYVNEFPDYDGDKATGKNTLIVVFGPKKARIGYIFLILGAYSSLVTLVFLKLVPALSLIALPALIVGIQATRTLYKHYDNRLLQPANAGTIAMHFLTAVLFSIGIWFGN